MLFYVKGFDGKVTKVRWHDRYRAVSHRKFINLNKIVKPEK